MTDSPQISPDPASPDPAPRDPGRWLRRALFVSVAVNLLVVGSVVGLMLTHGHRDGWQARGGDRGAGFARYVRALSPEDRAALRDAYRAGRGGDDGGDRRAAWRVDQADLLAELRADPFDPGAVGAVFERQITRMSAGMARGQSLLLDRIAAMSAAQRAAFADRLEQMSDRAERGEHAGPGRWWHRGNDHR